MCLEQWQTPYYKCGRHYDPIPKPVSVSIMHLCAHTAVLFFTSYEFTAFIFSYLLPRLPVPSSFLSGEVQALERQKDFFEPVRSERDSLREEVTRLRDELKVQ